MCVCKYTETWELKGWFKTLLGIIPCNGYTGITYIIYLLTLSSKSSNVNLSNAPFVFFSFFYVNTQNYFYQGHFIIFL